MSRYYIASQCDVYASPHAGMEPGPEHFGRVERLLLKTMTTDMSVSALVGCFHSQSV